MPRLHYNLSYTTYSTIRFLMDRFLVKVRSKDFNLESMVDRRAFALRTTEAVNGIYGCVVKIPDDDETAGEFTWILRIYTRQGDLAKIYFNRLAEVRVDQLTKGWSWSQEVLIGLLISFIDGF